MVGIGCPFATTNRRSRFSFKYTSNMQSPSARISIPGEAVECFTPNAAAMRAVALSHKDVHFGAVAFSRSGDPATGEFSDATVIRKFGDVPDDLSVL
jgi:hypothetical protein